MATAIPSSTNFKTKKKKKERTALSSTNFQKKKKKKKQTAEKTKHYYRSIKVREERRREADEHSLEETVTSQMRESSV